MEDQIKEAIAAYLEKETINYGDPSSDNEFIKFYGVINPAHFTHVEFCKELADSIYAAIKPHLPAQESWEDAPDWAEWNATDWNGLEQWFEKEPIQHNSGYWMNQSGSRYQKAKSDRGIWKFSLQKRPR